MVLGLHIQEISLLQAAVTHHWDQFAAYQQWIHSLFSLVSDNQRNYVTSNPAWLIPSKKYANPSPIMSESVFMSSVNSLPPLALDRTVFPHYTKKTAQSPEKLLNSLKDLAHTVDERFVLAYPADPPALIVLAWEEILVNLDYLLA
ncbi:hypothetical protein DSO57_1003670 [Entomophthora muscae]|uniref:Uncharacterized protein n=1 Tax=Entomophthora muscae TaxID=34485 RepID=A0ACC2T820_9FUNG|nr:hypothetical protein DSO57_1003670 [Entomophthora muscae]